MLSLYVMHPDHNVFTLFDPISSEEKKEKSRQFLDKGKQKLSAKMEAYRNRERKQPPNPKNALVKINEVEHGLKFSLAKQLDLGEFGGIWVIRAFLKGREKTFEEIH
jgi:hypothetical protein